LLFEHLIRDLGGLEENHTTIQEAIAVRHATEAPPSKKVGAFDILDAALALLR
jgi:hypothetical protein